MRPFGSISQHVEQTGGIGELLGDPGCQPTDELCGGPGEVSQVGRGGPRGPVGADSRASGGFPLGTGGKAVSRAVERVGGNDHHPQGGDFVAGNQSLLLTQPVQITNRLGPGERHRQGDGVSLAGHAGMEPLVLGVGELGRGERERAGDRFPMPNIAATTQRLEGMTGPHEKRRGGEQGINLPLGVDPPGWAGLWVGREGRRGRAGVGRERNLPRAQQPVEGPMDPGIGIGGPLAGDVKLFDPAGALACREAGSHPTQHEPELLSDLGVERGSAVGGQQRPGGEGGEGVAGQVSGQFGLQRGITDGDIVSGGTSLQTRLNDPRPDRGGIIEFKQGQRSPSPTLNLLIESGGLRQRAGQVQEALQQVPLFIENLVGTKTLGQQVCQGAHRFGTFIPGNTLDLKDRLAGQPGPFEEGGLTGFKEPVGQTLLGDP